jgi:hypothetical protein
LRWPRAVGYPAFLFVVSVGVNYVWEMAQMPLYQDMPFDTLRSWLLCFRASLGDGVIILAIWTIGFLVFRERYWFTPGQGPSKAARGARFALLLAAGGIIAVAIEVHALGSDRWAYSSLMPLVPYLEVGLSPFIQLLILPFLSMIWAQRLYSAD